MGKDDQNANIGCAQCKVIWAKIIQKESDVRFDYLDDFVDTEPSESTQKKFTWKDIIQYEGTYMNASFFSNDGENTYNCESKAINSMKIPSLSLQNFSLISVFGIDINIANRLKYKTIPIMQIPLQHLALQLCRIDAKLISLVEWSELQNGAWLSKDNTITAKNVLELIRFFNKVTMIVVDTIVSLKKLTDRKHAVEYFIKLADILYKINNFNSMQAIIAALNQQAIFRLKHTWKMVHTTTLQRYEKHLEFLDMKDNYKAYRTRVKELQLNHSSMMPFFGIFLSDVNGVISYIKFKNEQMEKLAKLEHEKAKERVKEKLYKDPDESETIYQVESVNCEDDIYGCVIQVKNTKSSTSERTIVSRQNANEYLEIGDNLPKRTTSLANRFLTIPRAAPVSNEDKTLAEDLSKNLEKSQEKTQKKTE